MADALQAVDLSPVGADAVRVEIDADGEYRCVLDGVDPATSTRFATALDEAVSPMTAPRYVLPRWVLDPSPQGGAGWAVDLRTGVGTLRPDAVVWHSVPTVLGVRAERAHAYAVAWNRWVGGGPVVYTGNPEGAGILAANRGSDPFDVTTAMRTVWH